MPMKGMRRKDDAMKKNAGTNQLICKHYITYILFEFERSLLNFQTFHSSIYRQITDFRRKC